MFDKFFEEHAPESAELPSAESVDRIGALLKSRVEGTVSKEEKPMKVKKIKGVLLVAAAAVITATALIFSATADDESDDKFIVRINNKRANAVVASYEEGKDRFCTITFELPCEILLDKNGKPVTEDSGVERRMVAYDGWVYWSEDSENIICEECGVAHVKSGMAGFRDMYLNDAMIIPVPYGSSISSGVDEPGIVKISYDEKAVKEFWENYYKDPENEALKWAEVYRELAESRNNSPDPVRYPPEMWSDERLLPEIWSDLIAARNS